MSTTSGTWIFLESKVTAEAELLAAITTFFKRLGLTDDECALVSNRKVLQSVLTGLGVSPEHFAAVCVLVDKLEKMPREAIESNLSQYGMTADAIDQLIAAGSIKTVDELESRLGKDDSAVVELRELFELAEGYGYVIGSNWIHRWFAV